MKKPAAKTAAATENAATVEDSRNLVPLHRFPLPPSPLSATLLSTPNKLSSQSLILHEKGATRRFSFDKMCGPRNKIAAGEWFPLKRVHLLQTCLRDSSTAHGAVTGPAAKANFMRPGPTQGI
jgi:hypothetical protein